MGAAAAASADRVIVTSDNPRHEDPLAIIDAAVAGIEPARPWRRPSSNPTAARAIELAIRDARPGDVVVIAGKGHETTQTIGDVATPFDDREWRARCSPSSTRTDAGQESIVIAVMIAGAVATLVSLLGTRFLIVFFRTRGRASRSSARRTTARSTTCTSRARRRWAGWRSSSPPSSAGSSPTSASIAFSDQAMIVWVGVLAMAFMGFLDDYIKVKKRHNRGIFWKQKNYVTMLMSFGLAWWLVATTGISETISFVARRRPRLRGADSRVGHLGGARSSGPRPTPSTSPTASTGSPADRR